MVGDRDSATIERL